MYIVMVIGLMVVAPIVSIIVELLVSPSDALFVVGKWFLFWGVGVRLFIAGLSQTFRPEFTAQNILGGAKADSAATQIVQELGFANIAFGIAGLVGAWFPGWAVPAALAPAIFLTIAGIRHIVKSGKNTKEWLATLTDLLVGIVLLVFVVMSIGRAL